MRKSKYRDVALITLITVVLLVSVEGVSSFVVAFSKLEGSRIVAERLHTEYDPLLGWINRPNIHVQDMYGPDKSLNTNSQRFRSDRDFDSDVPACKRRWICSGDSFTFGFGVDDDRTWCALLSSMVPNTETVNMGQGGYGLDQAYLWYMRDGISLQHDLVILAFVTDDINRMASDQFLGYPKPLLSVQDQQILTPAAPLPEPRLLDRVLPRYRPLIARLSVMQLLDKALGRERVANVSLNNNQLLELTLSIFASVNGFSKKHDRTALLVHLPVQDDYKDSPNLNEVMDFFTVSTKQNGWIYYNLVDDFKKLMPHEVPQLFIQQDLPGFNGSRGHYTEKGNQYIAELIVRHLSGNPATAEYVHARD